MIKKNEEKIIIHRVIKLMIRMKINDNHEDIIFLLIDIEYSSTITNKIVYIKISNKSFDIPAEV